MNVLSVILVVLFGLFMVAEIVSVSIAVAKKIKDKKNTDKGGKIE